MTRPRDWSPLRPEDPVPGDPLRVRELAQVYDATAREIQAQAENLRRLSRSDDYWAAESGRAFSERARELEGDIAKVEPRYTLVRDALRRWADDLEDVQGQAARALDAAKDAQHRVVVNAPRPQPVAADLDPAVLVEVEAREQRRQQALDDLQGARARLDRTVLEYEDRALTVARQIDRGLEGDPLKDSRWDRARDFAVKAVKLVADAAGWIALVAGVLGVILTFTPLAPVGLALLTVSRVAQAVSMVGHLALALTAEGPWLDVVLDVAALKFMRWGSRATSTVNSATGSAGKAAVRSARTGAEQQGRRDVAAAGRTARSSGRHAGSKANRAVAEQNRERVRREARAVARQRREEITRVQPGDVRDVPLDARRGVDPELALAYARARATAQLAPGDAASQEALRQARRALVEGNAAWFGGQTLDLLDKDDDLTVPRYGQSDHTVDVLPGSDKDSVFEAVKPYTHFRVVPLP